MNIGERIEDILAKKKMTIADLARDSRVSYNTIYAIVKRKSQRIDGAVLNKIAKTLDINTYELRYGRTVGERIETYREGQKLTQEGLSEKTNIPLEKIKAYEEDQKLPTDYDLCRICEKVFAFPDDIMPSPGLNNRITSDGVVVTSADDNGINEDSKRKLLVHYDKLNKAGKEAAFNQVKLLTKIPEYKKKETDKEE